MRPSGTLFSSRSSRRGRPWVKATKLTRKAKRPTIQELDMLTKARRIGN